MISLNSELPELALSDLDKVVGGGAIGDAATPKNSDNGLFKAVSNLGSVAVYIHVGEVLTQIIQH
jgi:hypothetical protein